MGRSAASASQSSQRLKHTGAADEQVPDLLIFPRRLHQSFNLVERIECAFGDSDASVLRDLELARIDTNQAVSIVLAEPTHSWNRAPRTDLDHDRLLALRNPDFQTPNLLVAPVFDPVRVVEHQNVRSGYGATRWAFWQWRNEPKITLVDYRNNVICGPGSLGTFVDALQLVNRSMAFRDSVFREFRLLEMPVHVARERERSAGHLCRPFAQDVETTMRLSAAIQIQTMPVEGPR